jgi:hypothetical protein
LMVTHASRRSGGFGMAHPTASARSKICGDPSEATSAVSVSSA